MRPPMSPRRFPPPWTVEELDACFVVRDHSGQQLAYVYFEDEPGRRSAAKFRMLLIVFFSFGGAVAARYQFANSVSASKTDKQQK